MAWKKNFKNGTMVFVNIDGEDYMAEYRGRSWLHWHKAKIRVFPDGKCRKDSNYWSNTFMETIGIGMYDALVDMDDVFPVGCGHGDIERKEGRM